MWVVSFGHLVDWQQLADFSLCWLCRSISLHLTDLPTLVGFSLRGLRCVLHPSPRMHLLGGWWRKGKQLGFGTAFSPSLYNVTEVTSPFYIRGLHAMGGQQRGPQRGSGAAIILRLLAQPGLAPTESEDFRIVRRPMLLRGFYGNRSGRWEATNKSSTQPAPGWWFKNMDF